MKPLSKLALFVPVIVFLASCTSTPVDYHGLYAGTIPVLESNMGNTEPFVLYLDIKDDNILYNGNNYEYTIESESNNELNLSTSITIEDIGQLKQLKLNLSHSLLSFNLEGTGRSFVLEKYEDMIKRKVNEFVTVKLTSDISHLSSGQKELLGKLFHAAAIMDDIYWQEACPQKDDYLANMDNPDEVEFFMVNYGPWERLNGDLPFLPSVEAKPLGSGFYPADMTREEFEAFDHPEKSSLYTLLKRDEQGNLTVEPYHLAFKEEISKAASLIKEAAVLAEDPGFKRYLELRAEAMLTDNYFDSDMAWMDMKNNDIDFVVGPIENYEDKLYNYKAAHESFILIKDKEWSEKLAFVSSLLPELQKTLPVPAEYKTEVPGSDSDLGAYDVVYYAGDCNASSKTIAINLPNDERVQLAKGSRKLQLKNAIRYKFEEILVPISNVLIAEDQREYIQFDAFFENTMYHEVAHGLGINNTINGKGTVRTALKEQYSALEEGKADILGLFLLTRLAEMGELEEADLMDNYVTFMASIFRSVRFGVASSHGKANMIRFYYFQEKGAFSRDENTGTYRIDFEKMQEAMNLLGEEILTIQGNGDYDAAKALVETKGFIRENLQKDLDRLEALNIPVDIKFEQGPSLLGL